MAQARLRVAAVRRHPHRRTTAVAQARHRAVVQAIRAHRVAVQVLQALRARSAVAHRVAAAADNTLREYVSTAWHTPCYNLQR